MYLQKLTERSYRAALSARKASGEPAIPHIGVILKDITFIDVRNLTRRLRLASRLCTYTSARMETLTYSLTARRTLRRSHSSPTFSVL